MKRGTPSDAPRNPLLLQRDAASGHRLAIAVLAVKLLKLRPPPLAGVLRIPEASRILVLADFLKVVILHLTALPLVLFLAAHIRFLPLSVACDSIIAICHSTNIANHNTTYSLHEKGHPLGCPSPDYQKA